MSKKIGVLELEESECEIRGRLEEKFHTEPSRVFTESETVNLSKALLHITDRGDALG